MPLSKARPRKMLHLRDIQLRGYEREDGLVEVEAHLTDVKTYSYVDNDFEAGEPVHDMWVRVALDRNAVIHECEAAMDGTPYRVCPQAAPNMERLKGLRMGKGFVEEAMRLVGGNAGCTHLRELLQPVATVAFQTTMLYRQQAVPPGSVRISPGMMNSCVAYDENGPIAARFRAQQDKKPSD